MECRNLKYNKFGTIDCEVDHPVLGWIPFTANPDDPEEIGREVYKTITESKVEIKAYVEPKPVAVPERTVKEKLAAIGLTKQELLDFLKET